VAAAERTDCRWLLSEDFPQARTYGQITIVNPFEQTPQAVFAVTKDNKTPSTLI